MFPIYFFSEQIVFTPAKKYFLKKWISNCIQASGKKLVFINYIFCNDRYLRQLNKYYLHHDYFTDVITFNYAHDKKEIQGEAYVSIDRINDHARTFHVTFYQELCRVLIHSALHLIGYNDNTPAKKQQMRSCEDNWLSQKILQQYLQKVKNYSY